MITEITISFGPSGENDFKLSALVMVCNGAYWKRVGQFDVDGLSLRDSLKMVAEEIERIPDKNEAIRDL